MLGVFLFRTLEKVQDENCSLWLPISRRTWLQRNSFEQLPLGTVGERLQGALFLFPNVFNLFLLNVLIAEMRAYTILYAVIFAGRNDCTCVKLISSQYDLPSAVIKSYSRLRGRNLGRGRSWEPIGEWSLCSVRASSASSGPVCD
jgi:hypothetical protein